MKPELTSLEWQSTRTSAKLWLLQCKLRFAYVMLLLYEL